MLEPEPRRGDTLGGAWLYKRLYGPWRPRREGKEVRGSPPARPRHLTGGGLSGFLAPFTCHGGTCTVFRVRADGFMRLRRCTGLNLQIASNQIAHRESGRPCTLCR